MPFRLRLFLLVYGNIKIAKNILQVAPNSTIRFVLTVNPRYRVGANEFKSNGCLPIHLGLIALNFIRTYDTNNKFYIFSDSLSVVKTMNHTSSKNPQIRIWVIIIGL